MKLIDILIENNLQWPERADGVVQDADGEVKFYAGKKPKFSNGVWVRNKGVDKPRAFFIQTASDYNTAIITKQEWKRKMSKVSKEMFADVKVGDKVWDSRHGWGVVDALVHSSDHPIRVDFGYVYTSYTLDGYYYERDVNSLLFWDEIELKAPPKPLPKLEVDTKVIVWDERGIDFNRHFSHFNEDGKICVFYNGKTSFTNDGEPSPWNNWKLAE